MIVPSEPVQPATATGDEWFNLPSSGLRLNGVLRQGFAPPFLHPGRDVEIGTLVDSRGSRSTLCLVDPEDYAAVVQELVAHRELLDNTVFVIVRGQEPPQLIEPLREAGGWAANAAHLHSLPWQARDPAFYAPIVAAEALRANRGELYYGGLHDPRTGFVFRYPLDEDALLAEFELGPAMTIEHTPYPTVVYSGTWSVGGAFGPGGVEQAAARAAWWSAWRADPRPRMVLANPFEGTGS